MADQTRRREVAANAIAAYQARHMTVCEHTQVISYGGCADAVLAALDEHDADELQALRREVEGLRAERRLTPTQRVVLGAVRDLIRKNGQPPTMQEISRAAGLNTPGNAFPHLRALEREGFLRRTPNQARGIELVEDGAA